MWSDLEGVGGREQAESGGKLGWKTLKNKIYLRRDDLGWGRRQFSEANFSPFFMIWILLSSRRESSRRNVCRAADVVVDEDIVACLRLSKKKQSNLCTGSDYDDDGME